MRATLSKTITLLALSLSCALVLADPPALVGRMSSLSGGVTISGAGADQPAQASLNWPVTSDNVLSTARGARAEFRVGSAIVRLDGGTTLQVTELDDDRFSLRLERGSVSVRVSDPAMLQGFDISTPDAHAVLTQPGRLRVDAGEHAGDSAVSVFDGVAQVDGGGVSITLDAGRRAEWRGGDMLTGSLARDAFDEWPEPRLAAPQSLQYVTDEVTGYEELDQYGSWSDSAEYGPVWAPRNLAANWSPYTDGRWIWLAPWGWTWVDAAPWGYAPSHYGSWVRINQRWRWAPGRERVRPVWAPALVGWSGGNHWQATRGGPGAHGPRPGWFPLSPRDHYVPGYRASPDYGRRFDAYRSGQPGPARPGQGQPLQAHGGPQQRPPPGAGNGAAGRPVPVIRQSQEQMARQLQGNPGRVDAGPVQRNEAGRRDQPLRAEQARPDPRAQQQQDAQLLQQQKNEQREQRFRELEIEQRTQQAQNEQRGRAMQAEVRAQQQNAARGQQQNEQRAQQQQNEQRQRAEQQQNEQRQRAEQQQQQQRQQQAARPAAPPPNAPRPDKHNEPHERDEHRGGPPQQER